MKRIRIEFLVDRAGFCNIGDVGELLQMQNRNHHSQTNVECIVHNNLKIQYMTSEEFLIREII